MNLVGTGIIDMFFAKRVPAPGKLKPMEKTQ
jgi:hypothetical protein